MCVVVCFFALFLINLGRSEQHTAVMKAAVEGLGDEQDWGVWCEIFKESIKNYV